MSTPVIAPPAAKRVAAVFDFDGTLSRGTSGIRFFQQLLGTPGTAWMGARNFPAVVGYALRYRHEECLEIFTRHAFRGRRAAEVIEAAEHFARHSLPQHLIPAGMARLEAHRARGDRCILVSRAYAWCLEPWARSRGIADILGTRLEVGPDGFLTGRLAEPSCDGAHKRTRLLALLGARDEWEVHAYGNSAGDHAMFAVADRAFIRRGAAFRSWTP